MKDWHKFYWKWHVEIGLAAVFVGLLVVGVVALSTRSDVRREAKHGAQAYAAVCALRTDLRGRVQDDRRGVRRSQAFLASHPNGLLGVTAVQIRASIAAQQRSLTNERQTVRTLAALQC